MATEINGEVRGKSVLLRVTPTITAGAYSSGYVIGGPLHFANALATMLDPGPMGVMPNPWQAILESIEVNFKGSVQTTQLNLSLFNAALGTPGNYADHAAPTWSASDDANFLGCYALNSMLSPLGTHTIYNLDGIGKVLVGNGSPDIYGVLTCGGGAGLANNPASTSDMTVGLGLIW